MNSSYTSHSTSSSSLPSQRLSEWMWVSFWCGNNKIPQQKVASSFFQHEAALRGVGRLLLLLHLNISISWWQSLASPSVPAVETNQVEIPNSGAACVLPSFHVHAWMHKALLTKRTFLAGLTAASSASGCLVANAGVTFRSRLKPIVSQREVW